ncbi:phosphate uptake regulator PhoU [Candidatus Woesearchaeota archaeon]|nr:MAG: phosphate uptake regulator PhoU [Candidatus Woesearchaeota archaeon]
MRRKVIQLGEGTHVITLPSQWARTWGIQKGSEVDVEEHGSRIEIHTENTRTRKTAQADLRFVNERTTRWLLSSLHKQGYDTIELTLDNTAQAHLVSELVRDLFIGFTIVHTTPKTLTLRAITQEIDEERDTLLRRAFLITLQQGEQLHKLLRERKQKDLFPLLDLEKQNNQLTNFCQRILNKKGHTDPAKTSFLYVITWNLEKISDDYKYLTEHFTKNTPAQETTELLYETNKLLREYYELFYSFNAKKLSALADQYRALESRIKKELPKDPVPLAHLLSLVLKIADFSASTFALHH